MSLREQIPSSLERLLRRPVALFATGGGSRAVHDLFLKLGVEHKSYDAFPVGAGNEADVFNTDEAAGFDLVIHTTDFAPSHPWLASARKAGCSILSEMEFAQQLRKGPTIVVTGTNGKTTLQEFITFCLKRAGRSAMAVGQHQYPLSRLAAHPELDGMTAVCELDPHYIWGLHSFRYDALFWTNFHEDHIEDEEERRTLFKGLLHLVSLSPEARLYFGDSVFDTAAVLGCDLPEHARPLEVEDYPDWVLPNSSAFSTNLHRSALALFRRFWLEEGSQDSLLKSAAENFEVRAHRLHVLGIIGKTVFWNDSKSSNFAAAEAALSNFEEPVVWIGGGHYRGGDLRAFLERVRPFVRGAILIGDASEGIASILKELGVTCATAEDLREAVEGAFNLAAGVAPVVFSPGFVAGEQYGDYIERGMCYENAVLGLKHQKGNH